MAHRPSMLSRVSNAYLRHVSRFGHTLAMPETETLPLPLGDMLRQTREAAGLTQVQAAAEIGVDQQQLSRWENYVVPEDTESIEAVFAWLAARTNSTGTELLAFLGAQIKRRAQDARRR